METKELEKGKLVKAESNKGTYVGRILSWRGKPERVRIEIVKGIDVPEEGGIEIGSKYEISINKLSTIKKKEKKVKEEKIERKEKKEKKETNGFGIEEKKGKRKNTIWYFAKYKGERMILTPGIMNVAVDRTVDKIRKGNIIVTVIGSISGKEKERYEPYEVAITNAEYEWGINKYKEIVARKKGKAIFDFW